MCARALTPLAFGARRPEVWRVCIIVGLVLGGCISNMFTTFPVPTINYPLWVYALAGLLTGFGTSMGSGCTSGHGICGLGRLSPRSFAAVCTFMATAFVTATAAIAQEGGCEGKAWLAPLTLPSDPSLLLAGAFVPCVVLLVLIILAHQALPSSSSIVHAAVALAVGATAGIGLVLAGMLDQSKVRGFLNVLGPCERRHRRLPLTPPPSDQPSRHRPRVPPPCSALALHLLRPLLFPCRTAPSRLVTRLVTRLATRLATRLVSRLVM